MLFPCGSWLVARGSWLMACALLRELGTPVPRYLPTDPMAKCQTALRHYLPTSFLFLAFFSHPHVRQCPCRAVAIPWAFLCPPYIRTSVHSFAFSFCSPAVGRYPMTFTALRKRHSLLPLVGPLPCGAVRACLVGRARAVRLGGGLYKVSCKIACVFYFFLLVFGYTKNTHRARKQVSPPVVFCRFS